MRVLDMLPPSRSKAAKQSEPVVARSSFWVRASDSGILRAMVPLGGRVKKDSLMGVVADPFGEREVQITSPYSGIIIGRTNLPLVNEGDALFHVARFDHTQQAATRVDEFQEEHSPESLPSPHPEAPIV